MPNTAQLSIVVLACLLTIIGWQLLWFLTDDAFISFRYASNWVAGLGPTWNPPPFQHVEGYSNFLWVALLSAIWWAAGVEPPQIANILLLLFGLGTLLLTSYWLAKIIYRDNVNERLAHGLFALALLLICTNKSFLTWLSSGLETSLFTFLMMCWAYACCGRGARLIDIAWPAAALSASLLALTRPDGLLFWAVTTAALALFMVLQRAQFDSPRRVLATIVGLAIVPLHLLWRHYYYHDWLPNTYYAKVGSPWPDMGLTYLLSYCLEYALYIPVFIALACSLSAINRTRRVAMPPGWLLVLGSVTLQVLYYTLIVGGDHFEYRVFHHLIPLTVTAMCALSAAQQFRRQLMLGMMAAWLVMQTVIPWTHWYYSKDLYARSQTLHMVVPIANKMPFYLKPLVAPWDQLQAKLIAHSVGLRHQEHKVFYLFQRAVFPPRTEGLAMSWDERNVIAFGSIGVPAWAFPHAAIIDVLGLNDRVLAKSSRWLHPANRQMAHDIFASGKYAECYAPNVAWSPEQARLYFGKFLKENVSADIAEGAFGLRPQFRQRTIALTDQQVLACESYPWTKDELYSDLRWGS